MNNVMLDLETMGSGPDAAIVTIGAVFFDPLTGELGAEFEAHIALTDSAKYGVMEPDTVLWWLGQSDEARAAIMPSTKHSSLRESLLDLFEWMHGGDQGSKPGLQVWGNGASFDNVILRHACNAAKAPCGWGYWNDRDVRTIVDLGRTLLGFDPKRDMPFEGVAHRALDDAKHQARYVSAIYQRMQAAINGCGMVAAGEGRTG
ncbi:3'-5' exoribonuclease [Aeromonas veronii]